MPQGAKNFTFSCVVTSVPPDYTLTATGSDGLAIGHVYTVDETNPQATTQFKGSAVTKNCWLVKGSEC